MGEFEKWYLCSRENSVAKLRSRADMWGREREPAGACDRRAGTAADRQISSASHQEGNEIRSRSSFHSFSHSGR